MLSTPPIADNTAAGGQLITFETPANDTAQAGYTHLSGQRRMLALGGNPPFDNSHTVGFAEAL
jgi:hypothetical protein